MISYQDDQGYDEAVITDSVLINHSREFEDRSHLQDAVDEWIEDPDAAKETYGHINSWDVSAITDFSNLFEGKTTFNSDIGNWDVSNGKRFDYMFYGASSFNQDISSWDVSNVNNFIEMFRGCLLYTSPSPRDATLYRMPSSA